MIIFSSSLKFLIICGKEKTYIFVISTKFVFFTWLFKIDFEITTMYIEHKNNLFWCYYAEK